MQKMYTKVFSQACFLITGLLVITLVPANAPANSPLPAAIISLPDNEHAILVEKQTQTLYIYNKKTGEQHPELVFKSACSTGEVGGAKQKAGDKKTPEGIYFLVNEYKDKYLTPVYGKRAFPTDYPHFVDKRQGKNGSAIWIHGTDKALKPMDSNGCIAMENDDVVKLSDYIRLHSTPLIITQRMAHTAETQLAGKRKQVLSLLDGWLSALETAGYHKYLSFYDETYLPDMTWWEPWLSIRAQLRHQSKGPIFQTGNVGIYRHGNMMVVLMDLSISGRAKTQHLGKRKLFLKETAKGIYIIGDLFQVRNKSYDHGQNLLLAGGKELLKEKKVPKVALIKEPQKEKMAPEKDPGSPVKAVKKWLAAWSAKDMDAYGSFYSPDFFSDGMTKTQWLKRKKRLAGQYRYIEVTGSKFKTIKRKDGVEVRFHQHYKSNVYSTKGIKSLKLVNKGGSWKIYRENWKER